MSVLSVLVPLAVFLCSFVLHLVIWRMVGIKKEIAGLFIIFIAIPIFLHVFLAFLGININSLTASLLLCLAVSSAYIQTYPALKEDIPSFQITLYVNQLGRQGVSEDEIIDKFQHGNFFRAKMDELQNDSLLLTDQNNYFLSSSGKLLASLFYQYRKLLGLNLGDG